MAKKCDVIIIGGGPGGLTCDALLAKWGLKPLLIEKNEYTGGKAVSPTNKDGFSYELRPKLQVPAQGQLRRSQMGISRSRGS
jgi:phytoene dehydrogenase-like protein